MIIDDIIEEARTYLGVPWVHQGRNRRGVDCVGFILLALNKFGISITEIKGYSRKPDGFKLKEVMDNQENLFPVNNVRELKKGDIILLKIRKHPQHVALLTESKTSPINLGMIHSYNGGLQKVIEHDFAEYWQSRFISGYRLTDKWQHSQ